MNKPKLDILGVRERRLDAVLVREAAAMSNLANYMIADSSAAQTQSTATVATTVPAVPATTPLSITTVEKKIIKRKLPEPRDG